MTQDEAFREAIVEKPDDDAPRLIYADWLDEHGQPARAEFIRIQIELARLPDEERERQLREREADLLTEHEAAWVGPAGKWLDGWQFHRGFLEAIRIHPEVLLERASALFHAFPLRRLALVAPEGRPALTGALAGRLAELGQFTRLTDLDCSAHLHLTAAGVETLLRCSHLTDLQVLNLSDPRVWPVEAIGPAAVAALPESVALGSLRELHLSGTCVNDAALGVLVAAAPRLKRLRALNLSDNRITDAGIVPLARSPHFRNLERLDLGGGVLESGLGENGLEALSQSPHLGRLQQMDLGYVLIAPDRLFRSPLLRRLSDINLWSTYPEIEDLRALLAAPRRAPLRRVRLDGNSLGSALLELLGTAPKLAELTELHLSACYPAGGSLAPLLTASGLPALRHLHLDLNGLDDEAARSLATWPGLSRLTTLSLARNRLTRAGVEALACSPGLAGLRVLNLERNPLGSEGVQALAASPYLMNLTDLNLGDTEWDVAALRALAQSNLRGLISLGLEDHEGDPPAQSLNELLASPGLPRLQVIDLVRGGYQETPLHSRWRCRPQVLRWR